ncbi:DUF551 domain-containing protein [Psychrobacter pygoscelis]|uniref:DUF551 domain-containing protein n=1 Tax=Psychrobacter pygoscelis TaxID=2488563 RepID=UPI0013F46F4D|nr:DUF551 domain-containing protein [Psychrobacter pygoscelis]
MTKEQIKKLALDKGFKLKEQPDGTMDLNPYVYEFAEALLVDQWISVDEQVPDDCEKVLVFTDAGYQWTGHYNHHSRPNDWLLHGWTVKNGWHPFEVTHWMPLPTLPKEINDE